MCLIISAGLERYSGIQNDLKNSTLLGTDNYPKITTSAYGVLCRYKKTEAPCQVNAPPVAVRLAQSGDTEKNTTTPVNGERFFPKVTCHRYQETVHHAGNCPSSMANTRTVTQSLQVGLTMNQTTKEAPSTNIINLNWILLDT